MSIIEIDGKGRMTIPEKFGIKKTKAIVIQAGSYFITIPISKTERKPANWLSTSKDTKELKNDAEKLAQEDAVNRAKRRHQLYKKAHSLLFFEYL